MTAPAPSSSIFGIAKPVDTAARETEIEERLMLQKISSESSREIDVTEVETEIEIAGIPGVMEESQEIKGGHTHRDRKRIKKTSTDQ